jgi:hypothetical protein
VANAQQSVTKLLGSADIIAPAVAAGNLKVVGGVCELTSGRIRLLA